MTITMLNGLGCGECGGICTTPALKGFGDVVDYDVITIGGVKYSANQILDKTVVAKNSVKMYSNTSATGKVIGTIAAGQTIGKVYSYIKPSANSQGKSWLMFDFPKNAGYQYMSFYVPNEEISSSGLKEQGTKTVEQEVKEEEDQKLKDSDPVGYYLKKYALPALLIVGGIIILGGVAKEATKGVIDKKIKAAA